MTCSSVAAVQEGRSVPLLMLKVSFLLYSSAHVPELIHYAASEGVISWISFFPPPESFVPDEPSFPTPSSPPPPRLPDPLSVQEVSSPSRHRMVPGSVCTSASDPFSPSAGVYVAEQGLLGNVLSQCEELSGGAEPLSPWAAGEGGYCRAPGFEREDQVRKHRTGGSSGMMDEAPQIKMLHILQLFTQFVF